MRILAAGLFAGLLLGSGGIGRAAEAVEIVLVGHPDSPWSVEVSGKEGAVTARHAGHPGFALEIDCDDEIDDGRREGIVPVLGERRLEGEFWGATTPFFHPILVPGEHTLEQVRIESGAERLRVRFEGGSYALLQPAAGRERLFAELVFVVEEAGLTVFLDGLYYLLPSQRGTTLRIATAAGEVVRSVYRGSGPDAATVVTADTELSRLPESGGQHREYFEEVSRIELKSPGFGDMVLVTWIERLQIQVDRDPDMDSDLFELDVDHTFKDRGQRSVLGRLTIRFPEESA